MEEAADPRERPPWRRTVAVQAALCLALYAAFSLGEPQLRPRGGGEGAAAALGRGGRGGGVSFLSVSGGARQPAEQARLLRQMESVANVYEVKLVLNVAQFGEEDPLWQNGSLYFQALKIPWYSTASHGQIVGNFLKKVKMPYDQILEIIGVDTGPLQSPCTDYFSATLDKKPTNPFLSCSNFLPVSLFKFKLCKMISFGTIWSQCKFGCFTMESLLVTWNVLIFLDFVIWLKEPLHDGKISTSSREQITWLEQSLALTSSNWKIVVGYDPLVVCNEVHTTEATKFYKLLQRIFEKYAVNAFLSTGGFCGYFHQDNSMLYVQNPSSGDQTNVDGFLLHRVSPLEMETLFINLEGEVVQRSVVHQHGRGTL